MKICLIGQNLTNLILASVFEEKKLNVDIYLNKKIQRIKTNRTIALSIDNFEYPEDNVDLTNLTIYVKFLEAGDDNSTNGLAEGDNLIVEETRGLHGPQRGPVSITQITEKGRCYSLKEIHQISEVKSKFNSQLHMDGARFANALSALNCSPAEMTWMAGVDAVTFGCTKNGLMGVEAVIFFSSEHAREFELRRKRAGHLFSKNRYLAAQMLGYLDNNLWLELAKSSNKMAKKLSKLLGILPYVKLHHETEANMIFADMPRKAHQELFKSGAKYYLRNGFLDGDLDEFVTGRFVCSWSTTEEDIKAFITAAQKVNC